MPRIRQYINKEQINVGPLEQLAGAQQRQGYYQSQAWQQGFSALGRGIEEFGKKIEQDETTALAANLSKLQANLSVKWQDTLRSADPADPNVASKFMEDVVNPALEQAGEGFVSARAQDMFTKASAGIKADMFVKSAADQSNLSGQNAINSLQTMANGLSTTALNDPHSYKNLISLSKVYMDGLNQTFGLPAAKRLEMERRITNQIAQSAVTGLANQSPEQAKKALKDGEFSEYLDGTETNQLMHYADAQIRAEQSAIKAAQAENKRQQKEAFRHTMATLAASTIGENGEPTLPPQYYKTLAEASRMQGADASQIRSAVNMGHAIRKEIENGTPAKTDPNVYSDFRSRLLLPEGDPDHLTISEIIEARAQGNLNTSDFNFFKSSLADLVRNPAQKQEQKNFDSYLKNLKGYITKSTPFSMGPDVYGDQRWAEYQRDAQETFARARAAGKSIKDAEAEVLDMIPHYQLKSGEMRLQRPDETTKPLPPIGATPRNVPKPGGPVTLEKLKEMDAIVRGQEGK